MSIVEMADIRPCSFFSLRRKVWARGEEALIC
jgi:hypothetical protein